VLQYTKGDSRDQRQTLLQEIGDRSYLADLALANLVERCGQQRLVVVVQATASLFT
jgi:hypothetical protein